MHLQKKLRQVKVEIRFNGERLRGTEGSIFIQMPKAYLYKNTVAVEARTNA